MTSWKANRLRILRAERRLTQRAVAAKLHVSQSTYSLWETAFLEPDGKTRRQLAKVFRVPVEALIAAPQERKAS